MARTKTGAALAVSVDGTTFTVDPDEITAMDASALRRATGLSVRAVMQAAQDDPDIDIIAALVWLARRRVERELPFKAVAEQIGYGSDIQPANAEPVDEASPET